MRGDPSPVRRSRLVPRTRLAKALAGAGVIAYALTFTAGEPIVGVALFVVAAIVTVVVVTKQDLHRGARDWLAVISGGLALLAGVLIAAGVDQRPLAATVETDSWAVSSPGFWESLNWYILGTAVVAGAAGICTIASRTRSLVGPGVIVGAAAASTWGLVFFAGELNAGWRASPRWPEFAGHVALILAAGLACIVVKRNGAARLVMRRPRDARSWLVLTVGGLATAALVLDLATALYHTSDLERLYVGLPAGAELGDRALAYRVAIIMAVNTPLWAAVAAPRRFGLSVFTGFIGGGAAIALCDYAWGTQA